MRAVLFTGAIIGAVVALFVLFSGKSLTPSRIPGKEAATSSGVTFQYPDTLGTSYIGLTDWPPQVQFLEEAFSCNEAGDETVRAGRTEPRTINGQEYCVTVVSEGAAGSIYRQYAYAFPFENGAAVFTFSLRFPRCLNYDEPQRAACIAEEQNLSLDTIVDEIRATLKR